MDRTELEKEARLYTQVKHSITDEDKPLCDKLAKELVDFALPYATKLEIARELIQEVFTDHSNPLSPDYNQCEISPCRWCENASAIQTSAKSEDLD